MKNSYTFDCSLYDFTDKSKAINDSIRYTLSRLLSMFKYKNLPSTIPHRMLELYLLTNGNVAITSVDSKLYAFTGGLGGEPDEYYQPTIYTIANPALNISKNLKIDDECIVIRNDSLYIGLLPLIRKFATAMLENDLTMYIASINVRIPSIISASDERTKQAGEKFISDVYKGKLGVIAESAFLDGIKSQPFGTNGSQNRITDLIEYEQYLKASFFNEIGLNANYNMKRESLNSSESKLNDDILTPLIDDMLNSRREGLEKVNEMFGTDISVDFNSAWKENEIESDLALKDESNQLENNEGGEMEDETNN